MLHYADIVIHKEFGIGTVKALDFRNSSDETYAIEFVRNGELEVHHLKDNEVTVIEQNKSKNLRNLYF